MLESVSVNIPSLRRRPSLTGAAFMFLVLFFESICFPTIVALGTRGLGSHYKRGSGWIIGGVLGGAAVPPLLGVIADLHNNTGIAMVVPLAVRQPLRTRRGDLYSLIQFFASAVTYPITLNFVASCRIPADATTDSPIGLVENNRDEKGSNVEHIEETVMSKV